ncbi:MAG: hypothetical protein EXQ84_04570 [Rhodospirillaceae bacterium]|nr:hypothetical protein [Rhodospirillaceae bacterium]
MSKIVKSLSQARDGVVALGRRALLRRSLFGGAALAAGALAAPEAGAAESPNAFDPATEGFRRVVVGNTKDGKSVVLKDEKIKRGGDIWRSNPLEPLGANGPNDLTTVMPASPPPRAGEPTTGTRWFYATIAPSKAPLDRATIKGWHRVSSISYVTITNGELTLLMEEGQVTLRGGDLLVMRNAMHTWHNATAAPVGMLITQILVS